MITREEWLRNAVEKLNSGLFNGELDTLNKPYQISTGTINMFSMRRNNFCARDVFMPYQGEDATMEDFFPPTIVISHFINDPIELLGAVALGCIQVFFDYQRCNNKFKKEAERFYFEFNKSEPVITDYLRDQLFNIYGQMVKTYGEYPGKAVYVHMKDKRDEKPVKNTLTLFCPNEHCGYELKISRKMYEKFGQKTPTCICGAHMAVDLSDEEENSSDK